jgi:hypothetical protein
MCETAVTLSRNDGHDPAKSPVTITRNTQLSRYSPEFALHLPFIIQKTTTWINRRNCFSTWQMPMPTHAQRHVHLRMTKANLVDQSIPEERFQPKYGELAMMRGSAGNFSGLILEKRHAEDGRQI